MSTCLSFVVRRGSSSFNNRCVCLLSVYINRLPVTANGKCLKKRCQAISSFAVLESPNNSASVDEVVTVCCRDAFQSIGPPESEKRKPFELLRSGRSANAASE